MTTTAAVPSAARSRHFFYPVLIGLGLAAFSLLFLWLDSAYYRFAAARFPAVGEAVGLANLWGVVSRAHLLVVLVPLALWRPRQMGFQLGRTRQHWRLLLGMLAANCGVIGAYLWLTSSATPYSGNQWLLTEVVTVPIVEEVFWRGLVLAALLGLLQRHQPPAPTDLGQAAAGHLAVWFSGVAFGLLHGGNILAGVPAAFVAVQVLNATVWGVVYGYARVKTDSIYPPMLLHAAMNLVVILF